MIKKSELRFCILFLEGNWAYNTNLFISIKNLEPKNAILSKGIFLANCVKIANFLIIWCPYSSRVGESLSLCILKTTNFRLCVKQNVPTYDALSTKNFCSKSNTFWDISSQSFQIGSGTPCIQPVRTEQSQTNLIHVLMFYGWCYQKFGKNIINLAKIETILVIFLITLQSYMLLQN